MPTGGRCTEADCDQPAVCRGLCRPHYNRHRYLLTHPDAGTYRQRKPRPRPDDDLPVPRIVIPDTAPTPPGVPTEPWALPTLTAMGGGFPWTVQRLALTMAEAAGEVRRRLAELLDDGLVAGWEDAQDRHVWALTDRGWWVLRIHDGATWRR